jgi:hypothetical protein
MSQEPSTRESVAFCPTSPSHQSFCRVTAGIFPPPNAKYPATLGHRQRMSPSLILSGAWCQAPREVKTTIFSALSSCRGWSFPFWVPPGVAFYQKSNVTFTGNLGAPRGVVNDGNHNRGEPRPVNYICRNDHQMACSIK